MDGIIRTNLELLLDNTILTAGRSNQSILKDISPEYSMEGLMLKLLYFGHLKQRADSLEKTMMLGKIEGRRRGWQRIRWLDGITDSIDMVWTNSGSWDGQEGLACYSPWGHKESDTTEWLNWTELTRYHRVKDKNNCKLTLYVKDMFHTRVWESN